MKVQSFFLRNYDILVLSCRKLHQLRQTRSPAQPTLISYTQVSRPVTTLWSALDTVSCEQLEKLSL